MKIGVALAGGGLKGAAHIGALKALEDLGVEIEYISGTSSGSMFAVTYALGYSFDEIKDMSLKCVKKLTKIKKMPFVGEASKYVFTRKFKMKGFINGKTVEHIVDEIAEKKGVKKLSDINKKMAVVTVDAKSTKECVLWTGDEEIRRRCGLYF
ncbi:MAG: patatin-like phospholipase family protein [Clostridia bacterium]|nr:patatin-like phospholipase family protein [Clostridia bacterium]